MAIRLNQKINLVSGFGSDFSAYRNIASLLILNAANLRERLQEQGSEPVWSPRITEKRKNVAARILLMRTACNFQKGRPTLGTWRKLMELVQEVVKPGRHYGSLFFSPKKNLQNSEISRAPALARGPF